MKVTKALTAEQIPVIDISALRAKNDIDTVARSLVWAASELGFIYVRGHGVSPKTIQDARSASLQFFALPDADKIDAEINTYHHGHLKAASTVMYDGAKPDLKESFNFGIELDSAAYGNLPQNPLLGPNKWPSALKNLKSHVYPFFEAASSCAEDLLRGFAVGVGLDENFFIRYRDRPVSRGSLQYYPPQTSGNDSAQFGVAPHTDFGVLTVLCQDNIGGLELQMLDGQWRAVPPIDDTLVINVGDLLERWSNGLFRSTPHRVINRSRKERLSLVLAYDPNFETPVVAQQLNSREPPKWESTTVGNYLIQRFEQAFPYRSAAK
ncbi:MAG: 2OG-Fe(II) oxygenase [Rhodospirillaceae bacterium]|nr:2OG-Fe(II) oxygenase [Rhodospirillaceae bacterium]